MTLWNYFFVILTVVKFPLPDVTELPFPIPTINLHLFVYYVQLTNMRIFDFFIANFKKNHLNLKEL